MIMMMMISSSIMTMLMILKYSFLFIFFILNNVNSVPSTFLKGSKISCNQEGQIVVIPFLRSDPCITCMCLNSVIDCFKNTCPQTMNCYHYNSNATDSCCRKCLSCRIDDRIINNGELIQDRKNICKSLHCNSGTLTLYQTECYVPCDKPIRLMNHCCPSCNACPNNARDGDEVNNSYTAQDPCIRCYCFKGQMICHRKVCPALPCHRSEWTKQKNSCCPICKGSKVIDDKISKNACLIGDKIYQHMEKFIYDECTTCICQNSTNICHRQTCSKLSCPKNEQITVEGQCCPRCQTSRVKKGMNLDCIYQNSHLKNGEWTDSCKQCKCIHGRIECINRTCPHAFVCPFGHRKVRINGDCCESCVPEDGRCILDDSMANITTYDGKNYYWNGRCNYVLTKDCDLKRFSIHLLNKFHNSSIQSQPIYRGTSLLVKIGNVRIFLSHLGRIRVNRSLVQLPYIQIGHFSIVQIEDRVKLHAIIGVDILWQRNRSIQIKLKSHFRDQMCGLCGNFNLDPDDEFKTKTLKQLVPLERFVNSFKIGQNVLCPKSLSLLKINNDNPMKICYRWNLNQQAINSVIRVCNKIRKKYGTYCKEEEKVYRQCLEDMCTCSGDKQCQCYSIERFINHCKGISFNATVLQTPLCKSYQCPAGSKFTFCSYECRKTCQNRKFGSSSRCSQKECKSACECIGNRVWYKGQCIPGVMCPY